MTTEKELRTPPVEWYTGIASPEEGIRLICLGSRIFYSLHLDLREQLDRWGHTQLLKGEVKFPSLDVACIHTAAGNFIQRVTGFTPEALIDYKILLEECYIGRSMGPFQFPVKWIDR